jgi:hypothetical protein
VSVDRDGRQGWSRASEEAWLRVFGRPDPPEEEVEVDSASPACQNERSPWPAGDLQGRTIDGDRAPPLRQK